MPLASPDATVPETFNLTRWFALLSLVIVAAISASAAFWPHRSRKRSQFCSPEWIHPVRRFWRRDRVKRGLGEVEAGEARGA